VSLHARKAGMAANYAAQACISVSARTIYDW
jgi:hypothetical protein